jgi:hypothetical protein
MKNPKLDACVYILTCMLQRQEISKPGYLSELIAGVQNDRTELSNGVNNREYIDTIFAETVSILEKAQKLLAG